MTSKTNLGVSSLVPLQRAKALFFPIRRRMKKKQKKNDINRCPPQYNATSLPFEQCTGCTTRVAEANTPSDLATKEYPNARDIQRTRPPGPHNEAKPCPPKSTSQEIGRRTLFGVPAATCDRSTPFNARLISGEDVGNSICKLTRWNCNTAEFFPAIAPAWLPSNARNATKSSNS